MFVFWLGAIDVSGKYTIDDMMKASGAVVDYCLMDENVQVNGFSMIQDMSDLTLKHQSFFGVDAMRRSMKVWVVSNRLLSCLRLHMLIQIS